MSSAGFLTVSKPTQREPVRGHLVYPVTAGMSPVNLTGVSYVATITNPTEKMQALESATYDVKDVARLMKCSTRHVRRMIDAREVPGLIRFGRLVRFHRGIIHDWLSTKAKA